MKMAPLLSHPLLSSSPRTLSSCRLAGVPPSPITCQKQPLPISQQNHCGQQGREKKKKKKHRAVLLKALLTSSKLCWEMKCPEGSRAAISLATTRSIQPLPSQPHSRQLSNKNPSFGRTDGPFSRAGGQLASQDAMS